MAKTSDYRITIDGSGGLVSNVSQHSGRRGDFTVFQNVITDVGNRIVKREGKGATLGSVAGTEIQVIHEYTFIDPATGTSYTHVLGAIDSGSYLYATINSGATWTGQTLPITPTAGGRWFFVNDADNRSVLAGNGKNELLIGQQAYASITLTSVGTTATATSSAPHPFTTGQTVIHAGADQANYNVSAVVTVTSATSWTYTIVAAASPATGNISATMRRIVWRKAGQAAPTANLLYNLIDNDPPYNTGTISCTNGSAACVGIGTAWTTGAAWVGKRISIDNVLYTIATVTTGTAMTLTETFKEALTGPTTYAYNIFAGVGDWITPLRYAAAYRNPNTGHISNVGPVLEITEQNQFGRTITVTFPGSAENTAAYNNGYTQIQFFRSPLNGFVLVALNEFAANNATGAAIVHIETVAKFKNSYLTDQMAPFDSNDVPPKGIQAMAFHQDRMWALTIDGRLRFTPAPFELSYGVAIESWPDNPIFSRRIRAVASGLLVTGSTTDAEALIIQTARGDYTVGGLDLFAYYVHLRRRTRKSGGFLYAATDVDGDLAQFYRDKRLMAFPGGENIGRAIQNKLTAVRTSLLQKVRLHWYANEERNLLLLSVPSTGASTANDATYVFDLDKGGLAAEWSFGISAFATVHDATTGELQLWGGDSAGAVYRLLGTSFQDAGANFAPVIETSILRPLESERWSNAGSVELYVNDATGTWTGYLFIHEQTSTGATDGTAIALTFRVAPSKSQSAQGKRLVATFTHSKRTISEAFKLRVTYPTQNAALWIEKAVVRFTAAGERVA